MLYNDHTHIQLVINTGVRALVTRVTEEVIQGKRFQRIYLQVPKVVRFR